MNDKDNKFILNRLMVESKPFGSTMQNIFNLLCR